VLLTLFAGKELYCDPSFCVERRSMRVRLFGPQTVAVGGGRQTIREAGSSSGAKSRRG
jgi:hypothetical protein